MPEVTFFQTVTGETADYDELIEASETDMILKPDYSTICFVPWVSEPTAQIIHDCTNQDGSDVEFAPRNVLKRVLNFYHEKGWEPIIAPEMEFYLTQIEESPHNPLRPPVSRYKRPEKGGNAYSMDTLNEFDPLLEMLYQYCEQENLDIDTMNHEYGTAQLEMNFRHGEALKLADQVFHFKRSCREVAIRHNMYATFMAKPMEDQPGSAMHFHQSVINRKTKENIFVDAQGKYSENFYYFIGGLQKYIPLSMAFYGPNVNSYRRLVPDEGAPTNTEWGIDNRTSCIRVPFSSNKDSIRVENRLAGADTNPYLVIAASLAAGYLGIEEKIQPRAPIQGRSESRPNDLPMTMDEAIRGLDVPNALHNILGRRFIKIYRENDDEVLTPPQAVKKTAAYLAQKGITGNLRYEAEQLVADVLNTDRLGLYLWYDRPFSPEEKEKLRSYVRRRAFGEPSAYILGYTYFHSRRFRILADVLIPRPDSEELVMRTEESITRYRTETGKNVQEKLRLLEIGCGSGALLCTLGTENQHLYLFGLDISAEAVKIAILILRIIRKNLPRTTSAPN
ncbi:hypothetical protein CHS0354_001979 [Potamilus streckersoni]|uniref:GS catalytic domain-containing protein n=1 Tax=Potamilus streckersoni TaxID=2493646 RepID=A0AAE0W8C5_9BIVA|nr:hypothetical protein CHS0354_001979 [Potamilus streckersoni]